MFAIIVITLTPRLQLSVWCRADDLVGFKDPGLGTGDINDPVFRMHAIYVFLTTFVMMWRKRGQSVPRKLWDVDPFGRALMTAMWAKDFLVALFTADGRTGKTYRELRLTMLELARGNTCLWLTHTESTKLAQDACHSVLKHLRDGGLHTGQNVTSLVPVFFMSGGTTVSEITGLISTLQKRPGIVFMQLNATQMGHVQPLVQVLGNVALFVDEFHCLTSADKSVPPQEYTRATARNVKRTLKDNNFLRVTEHVKHIYNFSFVPADYSSYADSIARGWGLDNGKDVSVVVAQDPEALARNEYQGFENTQVSACHRI